jgi:hypothetical protein
MILVWEIAQGVLTLVCGIAVFVFRTSGAAVKQLEVAVGNLPKEYVMKGDYQRDIQELKDICHRMEVMIQGLQNQLNLKQDRLSRTGEQQAVTIDLLAKMLSQLKEKEE